MVITGVKVWPVFDARANDDHTSFACANHHAHADDARANDTHASDAHASDAHANAARSNEARVNV